jgi:hypothetical protein
MGGSQAWREVVGVVADVKHWGLDRRVNPEMYLPQRQMVFSSLYFVLATDQDPASLASTVREQLRTVDPNLPLSKIRTMEEVAGSSVASRRAAMILLAIFGSLALVLAAAGIYGVMAHLVALRTAEIGVRMTLGARPSDVLRLVIREGTVQAVAGLAIGLTGAVLLMRSFRSMLYGVGPADPLTLVAVAAILLSTRPRLVPARRAMRGRSVRRCGNGALRSPLQYVRDRNVAEAPCAPGHDFSPLRHWVHDRDRRADAVAVRCADGVDRRTGRRRRQRPPGRCAIARSAVSVRLRRRHHSVGACASSPSDGRFVFRDLPRGAFGITASKPGYTDGGYGRRRQTGLLQLLTLAEGERVGDVVIRVWKHGAITGTVVDEAGEPLVNVVVRAFRRATGMGARYFGMASMAVTDDRGMYRLGNLQPAEYVVAVVARHVSLPMSLAATMQTFQGGPPDRSYVIPESHGHAAGLGDDDAGWRYGVRARRRHRRSSAARGRSHVGVRDDLLSCRSASGGGERDRARIRRGTQRDRSSASASACGTRVRLGFGAGGTDGDGASTRDCGGTGDNARAGRALHDVGSPGELYVSCRARW